MKGSTAVDDQLQAVAAHTSQALEAVLGPGRARELVRRIGRSRGAGVRGLGAARAQQYGSTGSDKHTAHDNPKIP